MSSIDKKNTERAPYSKNRLASGFSLIELMVVLTIIALLILLAFPSYRGQLDHSHEVKAKTELYQLAHLLEQSARVHQSYESTLVDKWKTHHDTDAIVYSVEASESQYVLTADIKRHRNSLKLFLHHTGQQFHTTGDSELIPGWP